MRVLPPTGCLLEINACTRYPSEKRFARLMSAINPIDSTRMWRVSSVSRLGLVTSNASPSTPSSAGKTQVGPRTRRPGRMSCKPMATSTASVAGQRGSAPAGFPHSAARSDRSAGSAPGAGPRAPSRSPPHSDASSSRASATSLLLFRSAQGCSDPLAHGVDAALAELGELGVAERVIERPEPQAERQAPLPCADRGTAVDVEEGERLQSLAAGLLEQAADLVCGDLVGHDEGEVDVGRREPAHRPRPFGSPRDRGRVEEATQVHLEPPNPSLHPER